MRRLSFVVRSFVSRRRSFETGRGGRNRIVRSFVGNVGFVAFGDMISI